MWPRGAPAQGSLELVLDVAVDPVLEPLLHRAAGVVLLQWWELLTRLLQRQLVDVLVLDVLEVLPPEVADVHAFGNVVAEQGPRRLGDEDLAAVPGRADPRRADDVQADVALLADGRLAGVQAHPHAHVDAAGPIVGGEGSLTVDGGARRRLARAGTSRRSVALRVDLVPAGGLEDLPQQPPMVGHDLPVVVAQLLQQPRRALDVREQKSDGAARESHALTVQR